MDFEEQMKKAFEIKTIFKYDLSDFSEEEIEVIKLYCKDFKKNIERPNGYLNINKIHQPRSIDINGKIKMGLELLGNKDLVINNGLRLRTYIYYEKFINNKPNIIILLCKLLKTIDNFRKQHGWNELLLDNTFFDKIPINPPLKAKTLLFILDDLGLIDIRGDILTKELILYDELTQDGRFILSGFCSFWNFLILIKYVKKIKEKFLNEDYNKIRLRFVVFNRNMVEEKTPEYQDSSAILYFRIDFTDKVCGKKEPIFSLNKRMGLFEEIIRFEDIENRIEGRHFLKYHFGNYCLEFVYPFPFYYYYNSFKENLKSGFNCSRVFCEDLINFIFFDHFEHFKRIEFSRRSIENIEFLCEDGALSKISEKINQFIGYNLSDLDQPSFAIVIPIKSFKIIQPIYQEIKGKKYVEINWNIDNVYKSTIRCKVSIDGKEYYIPPEGKKIEIKNLKQAKFPITLQWKGNPDLVPLDTILQKKSVENAYYQFVENEKEDLIKRDFLPFLKSKYAFEQEIGIERYNKLQNELGNIGEKCSRGVKASDCEVCGKEMKKLCLTKLFAYHLGIFILPHCVTELADCYWISKNKGQAIVLKATNLNTERQYSNPFMQINKLSQRSTVTTIFFANNKSTANEFGTQALNLCTSLGKNFIMFKEHELIQMLYIYDVQKEKKNGNN